LTHQFANDNRFHIVTRNLLKAIFHLILHRRNVRRKLESWGSKRNIPRNIACYVRWVGCQADYTSDRRELRRRVPRRGTRPEKEAARESFTLRTCTHTGIPRPADVDPARRTLDPAKDIVVRHPAWNSG